MKAAEGMASGRRGRERGGGDGEPAVREGQRRERRFGDPRPWDAGDGTPRKRRARRGDAGGVGREAEVFWARSSMLRVEGKETEPV